MIISTLNTSKQTSSITSVATELGDKLSSLSSTVDTLSQEMEDHKLGHKGFMEYLKNEISDIQQLVTSYFKATKLIEENLKIVCENNMYDIAVLKIANMNYMLAPWYKKITVKSKKKLYNVCYLEALKEVSAQQKLKNQKKSNKIS